MAVLYKPPVKPLVIGNPKDFTYREKMYNDSLYLHNKWKNFEPNLSSVWKNLPSGSVEKNVVAKNYSGMSPREKKSVDMLLKNSTNPLIKPTKYLQTTVSLAAGAPKSSLIAQVFRPAPIYKKPTQPVIFQKVNEKNLVNSVKEFTKGEKQLIETLPLKSIPEVEMPAPELNKQEIKSLYGKGAQSGKPAYDEFYKNNTGDSWAKKNRDYQTLLYNRNKN